MPLRETDRGIRETAWEIRTIVPGIRETAWGPEELAEESEQPTAWKFRDGVLGIDKPPVGILGTGETHWECENLPGELETLSRQLEEWPGGQAKLSGCRGRETV